MGILKRLFGGGKEAVPVEVLHTSLPEFQDDPYEVVGNYGSVIEARAKTPSFVADESKLPYPKEQIKRAIIEALKINALPQLREHLKTAYLELSMWQKGVGQKDQLWTYDILNMNPNDAPEKLAQQLSDQNIDPKWERVILQENEALKKELEDLGLW
jgi:hypothetical protein